VTVKIDYGEYFNIAHIEPESHIYGPGKRFVIWLQGCSLACEGCWNQEMWSFRERELIHRQHVLDTILGTPDIEGVTLLGGEPLQQATNSFWLLTALRKHSELTIILYTGYEANESHLIHLLEKIDETCDLLIHGRYQKEHRTTMQQWIGSSNQSFYYPPASRMKERSEPINEVELIITESGSLRVLGYPDCNDQAIPLYTAK